MGPIGPIFVEFSDDFRRAAALPFVPLYSIQELLSLQLQ